MCAWAASVIPWRIPETMFSFRRLAFAVVLGLFTGAFLSAQDTSSSSNPPAQQDQTQPATAQQPAGQPSAGQQDNRGFQSVQERIRARREQRRAQAIRDVYSHRYELNLGMGYLRFKPGNGTDGTGLQRTTYYSWNVGLTRYYSQRLGITLDGRGNYGTAFVGINKFNVTRPAVSTYTGMIGSTYRFYMQPKVAISGRVLGGYAHGNFSGDTNGFGAKTLGLWPDGGTFAASAAVIGEYNLGPGLGLRLAPEYFFTGFGSTIQASRGFTAGLVFRFGKQ
jgi:hypothetical protein